MASGIPEGFELRRSKRPRLESAFRPDFYIYILENDPNTYNEAMQSPNAASREEPLLVR